MAKHISNLVFLADYRKANGELRNEDVKEFLNDKRIQVSSFDNETLELLCEKHTLKEAQAWKDNAIKFERILLTAYDWLEDKIAETDGAEKVTGEKLLKECEKLIARNERIKKNINDDLASCRYHALDPIRATGAVAGTPAAVAALVKIFITDNPKVIVVAGVGGAVLGVYTAFHRQAAQLHSRAGEIIATSPRHIKKISKVTRNSFIGAALSLSVTTKNISEIEPRLNPQAIRRPIIVCSAKM